MKNFGEAAIPRGTWQIDPFGHTNTEAWLLGSEAGFESLYWGRTDYQDLNNRLSWQGQQRNQWPEWVWRGSHSLGKSAEVFAGQLTTGGYGESSNGRAWAVAVAATLTVDRCCEQALLGSCATGATCEGTTSPTPLASCRTTRSGTTTIWTRSWTVSSARRSAWPTRHGATTSSGPWEVTFSSTMLMLSQFHRACRR